MNRRRRLALVTLGFVALTAVMTWPLAAHLASEAPAHYDVYFNLWRLRWFAHAVSTTPARLFDANIFYPEPRTYSYSDAMIVEGIVGAPLLAAGLPPVLVHNLLILAPIAASGVGMFVLVRRLTASSGAGLLAGIAFAFAPYRFDHIMHMELQWTVWMPWAFWALLRTLDTGSLRHGLLTGLFITLQVLSSIYYGLFLVTLLPLVGVLLLLGRPWPQVWRSLRALAPGALLAAAITAVYTIPYRATSEQMGGRSPIELVTFSARPSNYLVATPDNLVWGDLYASRGRSERRLFPGAVVLLLALVGLLLRPPSRIQLAFLVAALVAFDLSLGLSGQTYPVVSHYLSPYRGLRALARLGVFVLFFLAALGGVGFAAMTAGVSRRVRHGLAAGLAVAMLIEYRVEPLALAAYPNAAPPLYAWLAEQPAGVVAELPMPAGVPGRDPLYTYLSSFHWHPMVNGYSGYYPHSYLERVRATARFPDQSALRRLRQDGVRYLVVHLSEIDRAARAAVLDTLVTEHRLPELGRFDDGTGEAVVFALR